MVKSVVAVFAVALSALAAAAPPAGVEADVVRGIAQVKAGQYAPAIVTLEDAIRRLSPEPSHQPLLVQAYLHLAVAHYATGDAEGALAELGAALDLEPRLSVKEGEIPPQVRAELDRLREQRSQSAAPARAARRRSALVKTGAVLGGGAVLAGGGFVLYRATRNQQAVEVTAIRYGTPLVVCPDGSEDAPVPFLLLIDVTAHEPVDLSAVQVKSIAAGGRVSASVRGIVAVSPTRLASDTPTTVRVEGRLACSNNRGNEALFGFMRFGGQLETSAGAFRFEAPSNNTMRYEMP